jgi:hypothetical protein
MAGWNTSARNAGISKRLFDLCCSDQPPTAPAETVFAARRLSAVLPVSDSRGYRKEIIEELLVHSSFLRGLTDRGRPDNRGIQLCHPTHLE